LETDRIALLEMVPSGEISQYSNRRLLSKPLRKVARAFLTSLFSCDLGLLLSLVFEGRVEGRAVLLL